MRQAGTPGEQQLAQPQLKAQARPDSPYPYILALDIGTSSVRALLFDSAGSAVPHVLAQHTYTLNTSSDGEVSVDAELLVDLVAKTIDEALAAAGPLASHIGAVAIDTFWHSLMGVDASGHPVMPLLTWEDTRPRSAAAELSKRLDKAAIHARTGAPLHASFWPAKLHWFATTQPQLFQHVAQWLSFGEYLHRQFLGRSICSLSMASGTGMLATRARAWDTYLQEILGLQPEQLPPLGDLDDSITGLQPAFASRWPVLQHVPWFPAIGDGAAANVGSCCTTAENWALTIGTSSAMRVIVSPDNVVPSDGLWLYLLDARRGLLGGALSEGGNVFAWLEATLKLPPLPEADPHAATLPPDGHGLTVLPFISGERSPGWHDEARLVVTGINTTTTPIDLLRACLEAIAYQLGSVYDQLNTILEQQEIAPTLIGSGGALLSSSTLQSIIADTLNTPLYPSLGREASARGAALLALEALGIIPDIAQVPAELAAPILPEEAHFAIYKQASERQRKLYQLLIDH